MRYFVHALVLVSAVSAGCGEPSERPTEDGGSDPFVGAPASASAVIGPEGGELSIAGVTLIVPPDALLVETELTVVRDRSAAPLSFEPITPVFRFEPLGTRFFRPATVRFALSDAAEGATVFWTQLGSSNIEPRETVIADGFASAEIEHFSLGFVGFSTRCGGRRCCVPATQKLDMLLVIDNSLSMVEEQRALAENLKPLVRALATGDLDEDGEQDFPVASDIRASVISSDMGASNHAGCAPELGNDGLFLTTSPSSACAETYPAIQAFSGMSGDDPDSFAESVGCVAQAGTTGCNFEQPLEATLKALAPSTAPIRFVNDSGGHGDGSNAGFLREDSVLLIVLLTDEDDCSASDPRLYDITTEVNFSAPPNLRCIQHKEALYDVGRYVDGLLGLRNNPSRLVFAVVAGVPRALVESGPADYGSILMDPDMQEQVNTTQPDQIMPSCDSAAGLAFPPRRIIETARQLRDLGAGSVLQSVCEPNAVRVRRNLLSEVADRLSGACN